MRDFGNKVSISIRYQCNFGKRLSKPNRSISGSNVETAIENNY